MRTHVPCRLVLAVLALGGPVVLKAGEPDIAALDAGWRRVQSVFSDPHTKNIYSLPARDCEPLASYSNGLLVARNRYPRGIEDCAIVGGIVLSMFVDRFAVTRDERLKGEARWVAEGLRNLTFAHGYSGYVSRGLHPADGRSIGALSSRDQVTHLAHGLWRYAASPLAGADDRRLACTTVVAVAEWMLRTVNEASDWNFGQADGASDPRGVCKMRRVQPHEAARLASVYAAAWNLSGERRYRAALDETLAEALDGSGKLAKMAPSALRWGVPDYALLQMSSSLEVLRGCVREESVGRRVVRLLAAVAQLAAARDSRSEPYGKWLCGAAERPLVRLMAEPADFPDEARTRLFAAFAEVPFDRAGSTRIVELSAAYWRWRRCAGRR